jgi:RNA polymerase sigma factor (sigma-70 family)
MAGNQLRAAIRQLLQVVAARAGGGLTDGELLERFVLQRDEAAFETLLWRHGPMVLRTCQRVLGRPQDVEDAFQATFLVLCRKAAAIGNQESVGGWLYKVAYRTALRARAGAARQPAGSACLDEVPAPEPAAGPGDDELRLVLDRELNRLPEKYRTPLVLHYLEGKTVEQVAEELGWRPGTVSGRLARARAVLRARLDRRRVALTGAALAGVLGGEGAAPACPAALLEATTRATAAFTGSGPVVPGALPARVLALARAVLRALPLTRIKITPVLLIVGVVAAGAVLLTWPTFAQRQTTAGREAVLPPAAPEGGGASSPGPAPTPATPGRGARRLSASGRVLDADGNPVAGATVYLRAWAVWQRRDRTAEDVLATRTTDAGGRFQFHDVAPRGVNAAQFRASPWDVVAVAPGRGLAWQHLTPRWQTQPLTLTLPAEGRIRGRLLSPGGRPVAGARVRALDVAPLQHGPVTQFTVDDDVLNLHDSQVTLAATSDAAGRFVLAGLPARMRFTLGLGADGYVGQTVLAATADEPQPNVVGLTAFGRPVEPVHSGAWELTLERTHRLRGQVRFADSGRPVAGARVSTCRPPLLGATSDAEGRFTLDGLPAGTCSVIVAAPQEPKDHLGTATEVQVSAEPETETSLALPRGVIVGGTVVDADTGQGLPRVDVTYWGVAVRGRRVHPQAGLVRTDARGRFRLVVPPGAGSLEVRGDGPGYQGLSQPLEVRAGEPPTPLKVALHRGLSVSARVLDPRGEPVSGARARLWAADWPGQCLRDVVTNSEGAFRARNLAPGSHDEWTVVHAGRDLGARVEMPLPGPQREEVPLTVRLRPLGALAGRVVDESGRPVGGAGLRLWACVPRPNRTRTFVEEETEEATTDERGAFRIAHLVPGPGERRTVEATARGYAQLRFPEVEVLSARTYALPDLVLVRAAGRVAGTVTDPTGRPCPDVRVSLVPRGPAADGPRPNGVVTIADGRFTLDGLPPGPAELEAEWYAAGPTPRDNRHGPPVRTRVEAGQQEVHLRLPAPAHAP